MKIVDFFGSFYNLAIYLLVKNAKYLKGTLADLLKVKSKFSLWKGILPYLSEGEAMLTSTIQYVSINPVFVYFSLHMIGFFHHIHF